MSCNPAETVGSNLWTSQLLFLLGYAGPIGPWAMLVNLYFFFLVASDVQCLLDAGSVSADGFAWMSGSAMTIWYVFLALFIVAWIATVCWVLSYVGFIIPVLGWLFWACVLFVWYVSVMCLWGTHLWAVLEMFLNMPAGLEPYTGPGVALF